MRIDCHTHVFNLLTAATPYALRVFLARKDWHGFPKWLNRLLDKALKELAETVGGLQREEIARRILKKILSHDEAKALLAGLPFDKLGLPGGKLTEKILGALTAEVVDRILDAIAKKLKQQDPEYDFGHMGLTDWIDYATIALSPSIADVTEDLMSQTGKTNGIIALMMDITNDGSYQSVFVEQMQQTSRMVLRYPGRFFPFVAVNPMRKNNGNPTYHTLMQRATRDLGFVGVKLYPSLGYPLKSDDMRSVYDHCVTEDLPIMLHCNHGGFTPADEQYWEHADPRHWEALMQEDPRYRNLRFCFGHFGGDENMVAGRPMDPESWSGRIRELIKTTPNVFADVAYHVEAVKSADNEEAYFGNLTDLMSDEQTKHNVLFGTDHWMVRVRCAPRSYWHYFRTRMRKYLGENAFAEAWELMTVVNPARYLGLPVAGDADSEASTAIRRYARFIGDHATEVGELPAGWLKTLAKEELMRDVTFVTGFVLAGLRLDRPVDRVIYEYFRDSGKLGMSGSLDPVHASDLPLRELRYYKFKEARRRSLARAKVANDLHKAICAALGITGISRKRKAGILKKVVKVLRAGTMRLGDFAKSMTALYTEEAQV